MARPDTVIYFVAERNAEGLRLAAQTGVPPERVQPLPTEAFTVENASGELWLVIGADRI